MNRRSFLARASLLAAAGLCVRPSLFAQVSPNAPDHSAVPVVPKGPSTLFQPLRRGAGYFTGRGGTIGWLSSKDALVAVDTQFPETASLFLAGVPERGRRDMDVVFNTHHHADHTSGNPTFKPVAKQIVAQRKVPFYQLRAAERTGTLPKQVFADTLFDEVWRHPLGDEIVTAQFFGAAHTGADSVVIFEKANIIHMGDLVFNRLYPVIDRVGGGNIAGWVKVLEAAIKEFPEDAIYVYGHGNGSFGVTGKRADLGVMRDYLSALLDYVGKGIAAGKKKEELQALGNLPGFTDFHLPVGKGNRFPANVDAAFDELQKVPAY